MSLIGTLLDLSVEELLQLVAVTRRSGVLELRHEEQTVWIGLRDGAIVRVAQSVPDEQGTSLTTGAADERTAGMELLLAALEWEQGDFWFEGWVDPDVHWPGPEGLRVEPPLSPQYLALEGVRLEDEQQLPASRPEAAPREPPAAHPLWTSTPPPAVIAIDCELACLEAIKRKLLGPELPVHIFQRSDEGLIRLKQYLVRGVIPALVIGAGAVDPLEPHRKPGWKALARRARSLAPAMRIVLLSDDAEVHASEVGAVVPRPSATRATVEADAVLLARLADALGAAR